MSDLRPIPLSVLDLATVGEGYGPTEALRATTELAQHVDGLGFSRFWLAEHHSIAGVASSSPAILIGHVAQSTARIRVGSGGVMLPNHSPLVVAEQFGTLQALHPGRIDLGIGRAPGSDQPTAAALRRSTGPQHADDFPQALGELLSFFRGFPDDHAYHRIQAVPAMGEPPIWLLGSSGYSAQVAAMLGLPFAFAHHFSAQNTVPALEVYRRKFQPSESLAEPYTMIAVQVVAAPTDEEARYLAGPSALSFVRLRQGNPGLVATPEQAAAHAYSDLDRAMIEDRYAQQAVGSPDTVAERLAKLQAETEADELMVTTTVHGQAERLRSYDIVRSLYGAAPLPLGLDASTAA